MVHFQSIHEFSPETEPTYEFVGYIESIVC